MFWLPWCVTMLAYSLSARGLLRLRGSVAVLALLASWYCLLQQWRSGDACTVTSQMSRDDVITGLGRRAACFIEMVLLGRRICKLAPRAGIQDWSCSKRSFKVFGDCLGGRSETIVKGWEWVGEVWDCSWIAEDGFLFAFSVRRRNRQKICFIVVYSVKFESYFCHRRYHW